MSDIDLKEAKCAVVMACSMAMTGQGDSYYPRCSEIVIKELTRLQKELSQARKLIAELVKMGEFYGNPDNYQRGKKLPHGFCIIFNSIDDDYERVKSHPVSDPFYSSENLSSYGGKHAREVLSNNKELIEKLTKE